MLAMTIAVSLAAAPAPADHLVQCMVAHYEAYRRGVDRADDEMSVLRSLELANYFAARALGADPKIDLPTAAVKQLPAVKQGYDALISQCYDDMGSDDPSTVRADHFSAVKAALEAASRAR